MRDVMMKAQALAEAILSSGVFQKMQSLEQQVTTDEAATQVIADYMEKRNAVEAILRTPDFDPAELAEAGKALDAATEVMDGNVLVKDMREAQ